MKNFLCFIALIACVLCASKKTPGERDPNFRNEIRENIIECILKNEGISETLKNHLEEEKNGDPRVPLHFNKIELTDSERLIIRNCRRETFKARRNKLTQE